METDEANGIISQGNFLSFFFFYFRIVVDRRKNVVLKVEVETIDAPFALFSIYERRKKIRREQ